MKIENVNISPVMRERMSSIVCFVIARYIIWRIARAIRFIKRKKVKRLKYVRIVVFRINREIMMW